MKKRTPKPPVKKSNHQANFKKAVKIAKELRAKDPKLKQTDAVKKAWAQIKNSK